MRISQSRSESCISPFINGFTEAIRLVFSGDSQLAEIVGLSLRVSGIALLISTIIGIPLGAALGLTRFRGKPMVVATVYTGMAFPPVVVGLFVYLLLSRNGVLGGLNWPWLPALYTPGAMIFAQVIIALPLVAGFTMAAVAGVDPALRVQVRALGASPWQTAWAILDETRVGVIAAVVAGFGGIISEVGAVMIVGGNIEGRTRVLTTAIVLETNKGNFSMDMALGIVLLSIAFVTNAIILRLQGRSLEP